MLQWIITILILLTALIWAISRIHRYFRKPPAEKSDDCQSCCGDCNTCSTEILSQKKPPIRP